MASKLRTRIVLVYLLAVYGCTEPQMQQGDQATPTVEPPGQAETVWFTSYTQIDQLFAELGYTEERWQSGIREVPRLYLANIPERWRSTTSKEVTVQKKKQLFFRMLGPLALRANELILEERAWLLEQRGKAPSAKLTDHYNTYRVEQGEYEELLNRVDSIPVSLILAQAAEESGWGTSRFAALGNALFGQWTYGKGIVPLERRQEKGEYSVAAFESPLESVRAYMRNINSHPAYSELRRVRAQARLAGGEASGHDLAKTLIRYSERGEDYVHSLHAIMRVNNLGPTDNAYLAAGPAIVLQPAEA